MASCHCKKESTVPSNYTNYASTTEDCDSVTKSQKVQPPESLKISLPITAYINVPVSTINNMQDRLRVWSYTIRSEMYANGIYYTFTLLTHLLSLFTLTIH